jgi:hypothetical protein
MSRYQEVKDRSQHLRSSQNIMRIIEINIHKAIQDEFYSFKRNRDNAQQSYSKQLKYRILDENEQRQRETELKNKLDEAFSELYKNAIQNTIQKFKDTISNNYGKLIGLNLKDNQTQKEMIIEYIKQSANKLQEPFDKFDEENYSFKKYKQPFINFLNEIKTKLIEIAQSLKIANPEIINEYINEIISTNPEEAKTYLKQLLESPHSGLPEEDRDKYSSIYYNKILVPFIQANAGQNPKAARQEIEDLIRPESKVLTERFKRYSEEFLPYLTETNFDFGDNPESEQKAKEEVGFDPFTTATIKVYIKVAEHYDKQHNYRMADATMANIEDKINALYK